jgi:hypothetical protein
MIATVLPLLPFANAKINKNLTIADEKSPDYSTLALMTVVKRANTIV